MFKEENTKAIAAHRSFTFHFWRRVQVTLQMSRTKFVEHDRRSDA